MAYFLPEYFDGVVLIDTETQKIIYDLMLPLVSSILSMFCHSRIKVSAITSSISSFETAPPTVLYINVLAYGVYILIAFSKLFFFFALRLCSNFNSFAYT